jgi:hypothetical protein
VKNINQADNYKKNKIKTEELVHLTDIIKTKPKPASAKY